MQSSLRTGKSNGPLNLKARTPTRSVRSRYDASSLSTEPDRAAEGAPSAEDRTTEDAGVAAALGAARARLIEARSRYIRAALIHSALQQDIIIMPPLLQDPEGNAMTSGGGNDSALKIHTQTELLQILRHCPRPHPSNADDLGGLGELTEDQAADAVSATGTALGRVLGVGVSDIPPSTNSCSLPPCTSSQDGGKGSGTAPDAGNASTSAEKEALGMYLTERVEHRLRDLARSVAIFLRPPPPPPSAGGGQVGLQEPQEEVGPGGGTAHHLVVEEDGPVVHTLIKQLPETVQSMKKSLQSERAQLRVEVDQEHQARLEYLKALVEQQQALVKLAVQRLHGPHQQLQEAQCAHLKAWFAAVSTKLGAMIAQVEAQTYTSTTVPALLTIRSHLDVKLHEVKEEAKKAEVLLMQYSAGGDELRELAQEYGQVCSKTKEKESYLERLRHEV